ncbi:aquaporin NIP1-1 [Manihot esculenta]|uniref:Uncharacterized protein n=1 Tax=Manihot esculenta TaxID=3983 RepID=A0A2C9USB1_MANES|nr:aquaporin NIP1-1 [Manihot esculenta]OAY33409.1 hypothetical protein MANES_13G093600v8 [Manihot esculenta]
MAAVSPSPVHSPKRTVSIDLSKIEEKMANTPSQDSTAEVTVFPINAHKIMAELMGTYVIIFIGCGSLMIEVKYGISPVGVAVAWGLVVMVMIYALGHVSGGHFNPAITIAFAIQCKYSWRKVLGYVASQIAGSTLAILTLSVMLHGRADIKFTVTQYSGQATDLEGFIWEFITSFILMLTICGVATDSRAINELSGVAVGAAMLFDIIIAGKITGASMNPARSIGAALVAKQFECLWVYIVAPILGMITASTMYCFIWLPSSENIVDKDNAKTV